MNEQKKIEDIKSIDIYNYGVAFYGGVGYSNSIRATITLFDINRAPAGMINFYDDVSKIEGDCFKNGIFSMNFPMDSYQAILSTLRSNRRVCITFLKDVVMLGEFAEPRGIPTQNIDTSKIN